MNESKFSCIENGRVLMILHAEEGKRGRRRRRRACKNKITVYLVFLLAHANFVLRRARVKLAKQALGHRDPFKLSVCREAFDGCICPSVESPLSPHHHSSRPRKTERLKSAHLPLQMQYFSDTSEQLGGYWISVLLFCTSEYSRR